MLRQICGGSGRGGDNYWDCYAQLQPYWSARPPNILTEFKNWNPILVLPFISAPHPHQLPNRTNSQIERIWSADDVHKLKRDGVWRQNASCRRVLDLWGQVCSDTAGARIVVWVAESVA